MILNGFAVVRQVAEAVEHVEPYSANFFRAVDNAPTACASSRN
jgi:hypothetical protein